MSSSRWLGRQTCQAGRDYRGPQARLAAGQQSPWVTVGALGLTQILAWGATYYLLAVLAEPIAADTGWPMASVVGGRSVKSRPRMGLTQFWCIWHYVTPISLA